MQFFRLLAYALLLLWLAGASAADMNKPTTSHIDAELSSFRAALTNGDCAALDTLFSTDATGANSVTVARYLIAGHDRRGVTALSEKRRADFDCHLRVNIGNGVFDAPALFADFLANQEINEDRKYGTTTSPCASDSNYSSPKELFNKVVPFFDEVGDNNGLPRLLELKRNYIVLQQIQIIDRQPYGSIAVFHREHSAVVLTCLIELL